ncbi:outer membrane protein OmpA-like peptidoglycan-associated protein [Aminobacter lissarensis]|uniref:Outer membrane protein OmpA-like peptidoglycan-associated protein n=1 Tax=Aminobacter carboxidus TaxID=376165 RepID=A0A8E1WHK7_9HYPH|nr:OmpA family protein [Aminobacter lissarensis]MBB6469066.1 outer membrane protein OmpA-like peptidoglycan-associated protein [Aminobacter lissarensis]
MKRCATAALALVLPSFAHAYTLTVGAGPMDDQPSRFAEIDIGGSRFTEQQGTSTAKAAGETSTFGLKDMDSDTRLRTEDTLSQLGARKEGDHIIVSLPGDVLFDFDKSDIRADARPVLSKLASVLEAMPKVSVAIIGHTDSKGADDYNQRLSQDRAESVEVWLTDLGVASSFTTEGKGESSPVAPNALAAGSDNPEGRQKNRRVEFIIGGNP